MEGLNPGLTVFGRLLPSFIAHHLFSPNERERILLKLLQEMVQNMMWSPEGVSVLFDALLKRFELVYRNDRSHLLTWMLQMLHCIQINYITPTWRSESGKTLLELVRNTAMTNEALKGCLAHDKDKTLDEILEEIRDGELNQVNDELLAEVRDIVSSVEAALRSHISGSQLIGLKRDLLIICKAAEKTHFKPRLNQMVSWCLMALSTTGRLLQVGTGEGKSYIVAMFAAFRAMRGEKVVIMSSSSVLAERDLRKWKTFYDILKISVDCNINKHGKDLKKCYESQVVYGTARTFAGDWLEHHFNRVDILSRRTFQCAIVDEVDSLMLDKGHHVVYLGREMPALQHLNPLLALIWATANQYSKLASGKIVGPKYPFHQVVLEQINQEGFDDLMVLQIAEDTGVLAKGTVKEIQRNPSLLSEKTANIASEQLVEFFRTVEVRFPSCWFVLHVREADGSIDELNRRPPGEIGQRQVSLLLNGGFCQYMYTDTNSVLKATEEDVRCNLHFTPCELNKSEGSCYIPGFLSELVESKLKVWIENAFHAQTMEIDHEYVLDGHGVRLLNYSSSDVVEDCMKWGDGLQQFLEMKHQSKLSDMTIITNYISNVGLLQNFKSQIYGLSGTLGQHSEIGTIRRIFNGIKTCQIPTFKRRKLFECQGVIMRGERKWIEKICEVVAEQVKPTPYRSPRAVLVVCETIKLAKVLYRIFSGRVQNTILYISTDRENRAIFYKKLEAGDVIIATNVNQTDLQVSDSVKAAGGLFVVQTFLPENARIEAQTFGHAAQQGSPGTAQMIVCFSHLLEPLQVLIATQNLLSFMENIVDVSASFQKLFLIHLRNYQRRNTREERQEISSLLCRILTENSNSDMMMVKEFRDASVAEQLAGFVESELPKLMRKEELFSQYLETLDLLYKSNNNKPAKSDVSELHEFWGMWLLTKYTEEGPVVRLKNMLNTDLIRSVKELKQREPPSSNVHYYTAHGSELQNTGKLSEGIDMFTKAINKDPCWAAVAFYNRAFASLTQQNRSQDPECLSQALDDLQKSLMSVELYCVQLDVTYRYVTQQTTEPAGNFTTRFEKQIMARQKVLVSFKSNIFEAKQKVDRAKSSCESVRVKTSLIYSLVSLEHLLPLSVILMGSARELYSSNPLVRHQLISHHSLDIFTELMNLESMGLTQIYLLEKPSLFSFFFSKISRTLH